jgi:GAF domain-containing protein
VIESAFARLTRDPEIPDSLPQRLASVLAAMTRRSPRDRITLAEASEAFERAIADEIARDSPPAAPPTSAPPRPEPIVDLPPDREFARITGIAARLIRVPSAFVVIGEPGFEASAFAPEAHRAELAQLASRVLLVDRVDGWVVDDVHSDLRTAGAVRLAPVRSMAVQPILAEGGRKVGVVAVLDALPRVFGADETATLVDLAHLVAHEVDLRRAVRRALFSRER